MKQTQLQQNVGQKDICLIRYCLGEEKKSLLATVIEIDEFSEYHPIKFICKIDNDELLLMQEDVPVSLVIKKSRLLLYVLLKGNLFQKSIRDGWAILSIDEVQFFAKEEKNNISSFKKISDLSMHPAA